MRPLIAASPARRDSASDSAPLSGEALQAASSNSASAPPEFFVIPRPSSTATGHAPHRARSEEHTSELQSLMRISYAVFCLKKNNKFQILKSRNHVITPLPNAHSTTRPLH